MVQDLGSRGDMKGYGNPDDEPDRAAAEAAVQVVAELYKRMAAIQRYGTEHPFTSHVALNFRHEIIDESSEGCLIELRSSRYSTAPLLSSVDPFR